MYKLFCVCRESQKSMYHGYFPLRCRQVLLDTWRIITFERSNLENNNNAVWSSALRKVATVHTWWLFCMQRDNLGVSTEVDLAEDRRTEVVI